MINKNTCTEYFCNEKVFVSKTEGIMKFGLRMVFFISTEGY